MNRDNVSVKPANSPAPLAWLALGTFAIGTEGFMIAPLLPKLAGDLGVTVQACGLLVTAFALTYAISSPILTVLTGSLNRRRLLILSMVAFVLANGLAWQAQGYWTLMQARILLACAAGLYVPSANALAGSLVAPERRGTALAIVNGGTSLAVAIGAPLGAVVGNHLGWRMTFAGVAVLATVATLGLIVGLPRNVGIGLPVASLRERIAIAKQPAILGALLTTTAWAIGGYTVFTYLAPFLSGYAGIAGGQVGLVESLWGFSAAIGIGVGGTLSDRIGSRSVLLTSLSVVAVALAAMSLAAGTLVSDAARIPILIGIAAWGLAGWAFFPAQQTRLMNLAGVKAASVVLSLNASFMYIGFSVGAALGSLVVAAGAVGRIGFVGAIGEIVALGLVIALTRRARPPQEPATAAIVVEEAPLAAPAGR